MANRQDDIFHLIGKLEASLESVKERKTECDKCFDRVRQQIKDCIEDLKEHRTNDKKVHSKLWRYVYYLFGLSAVSFLFILSIAKDDNLLIGFLGKILDIF